MAQFVPVYTSINNKTTAKWLYYFETSLKYFLKKVLEILKLLLIAPRYR